MMKGLLIIAGHYCALASDDHASKSNLPLSVYILSNMCSLIIKGLGEAIDTKNIVNRFEKGRSRPEKLLHDIDFMHAAIY